MLKGIRLLQEIGADAVEIFGDSMLVVNQLIGIYECKDDILRVYHEECCRLLREFKKVTIEHVPKLYNGDANRLAQHASGYRLIGGVMTLDFPTNDWRKEIVEYLEDSSKKVSQGSDFKQLNMCCLRESYIIGRLMEFYSDALTKRKLRS